MITELLRWYFVSYHVVIPFFMYEDFVFLSCSGPSRFDWDPNAQAWIYRRNKANLLKLFETELEQLCGQPISLF